MRQRWRRGTGDESDECVAGRLMPAPRMNARRGGFTHVVRRLARRAVACAVFATTILTGCAQTTIGNPTIAGGFDTESGERTVVYNPCTDLSDAALRAAELDPASKDVITDAPEGPAAWRVCQWRSTQGPYGVVVASSIRPQDDVRSNTTVTDFAPMTIGARAGLTYRDKADEDQLGCYVSMPYAEGMLNVKAAWNYSERHSVTERPPCSIAVQHARALEPFFPK